VPNPVISIEEKNVFSMSGTDAGISSAGQSTIGLFDQSDFAGVFLYELPSNGAGIVRAAVVDYDEF
jgi:hypothetical protein